MERILASSKDPGVAVIKSKKKEKSLPLMSLYINEK